VEAKPLRNEGATIMFARRLIVASGLAVASLAIASGTAGAACTSAGSMTQPGCVTTPTVAGNSNTPAPAAAGPRHDPTPQSGTTSLPFTGADFEGMAVVGTAGILAGGLLLRRRRSLA
jgi:LPXTG-motif cell wall-anchored protein